MESQFNYLVARRIKGDLFQPVQKEVLPLGSQDVWCSLKEENVYVLASDQRNFVNIS